MKKLSLISLSMLAVSAFGQQLSGLPVERRVGCSADLSKYMPNAQKVDTTTTRGMADNYLLWDNGETLLVKFMPGGSQWLRNKVMEYAKGWEQYANIKFKFVEDNYAGNTNIRIQLGKGKGANSRLGTACNQVPQNTQTMNLDTTWFVDKEYYINDLKNNGPFITALRKSGADLTKVKTWGDYWDIVYRSKDIKWDFLEMQGTTQHEFGHAIGLMHEQSYPGAIQWNKADSVYQYYYETNGWDRDQVDYQVFRVNDQFYANGTAYDPQSIMQYSIEPWQTVNGFSVPRNSKLSEGDKKLISVLYPKDKAVSDKEVAKINITNFAPMQVTTDNVRKGISVRPSFDMKTNSKLGEVYFIARLYAIDGDDVYAVKASGNEYNVGGVCGAAYLMRLVPNTNTSYNKGTNKNMELFIPFASIPDVGGKPVVVSFDVFLVDTNNGDMTKAMYSSVSNSLSLPKK